MLIEDYEKSIIDEHGQEFFDRIKVKAIQQGQIIMDLLEKYQDQYVDIIEIGRYGGYSLGLLAYCCPLAKIVSIDPVMREEVQYIVNNVNNTIYLLHGTSNDMCVINLQSINFALIDGDHSYRWASKDWGNIRWRMASGGIVMFDNLKHPCGCGKVFEEITGYEKHSRNGVGWVVIV